MTYFLCFEWHSKQAAGPKDMQILFINVFKQRVSQTWWLWMGRAVLGCADVADRELKSRLEQRSHIPFCASTWVVPPTEAIVSKL